MAEGKRRPWNLYTVKSAATPNIVYALSIVFTMHFLCRISCIAHVLSARHYAHFFGYFIHLDTSSCYKNLLPIFTLNAGGKLANPNSSVSRRVNIIRGLPPQLYRVTCLNHSGLKLLVSVVELFQYQSHNLTHIYPTH